MNGEVVAEHQVLARPGVTSLATGAEAMDRSRIPVSVAKRLYRVPAVPGQAKYRDRGSTGTYELILDHDTTGRNSSYAHLR